VSSHRIRRARAEDVPALPAIERAAAARFREVGVEGDYLDEVRDTGELHGAVRAGLLFVAADASDAPVGFALVALPDDSGDAHLEELDVHPDHAGRGIGRRLVETVCAWAEGRGHRGVTLSTFRDVPWNAPWYARLGFRPLDPEALSPALSALRANERAKGLPVEARVVMRFALRAGKDRRG
jgi:GNAT superfamily N-acetyltransferase